MSIHRDSAYQIGLTILDGTELRATYQALFRPVNLERAQYYSRRVGPSLQEILDAPSFEQVWARVLKRLDGIDVVCAHIARFDRSVLLASLAASGLSSGRMTWVCTHALAKELWGLRPCKLKDVLAYLGIRSWNKALRQAGPDSRHCARIMQATAGQRGWKLALRASTLDEPVSAAADPITPTRGRRTYAQILSDALPEDGSAVGQTAFRSLLGWDERRFVSAREQLRKEERLRIGPGRGGTLAKMVDDVAILRSSLPPDGSRIGRARMNRELGWKDRRFVEAVQAAVDGGVAGLGPGRGGFLYLRLSA